MNALPLFAQRYPSYAGHKVRGASEDAADLVERTGSKNVWMQRCRDLFALRPDWTAEEGITYYAMKFEDMDVRAIDKNLRPRFTDLTNTLPAFLYRSDERRGDAKIKPHVYRRTA